MIRQTLVLLGIGALTIGLAPIAQAQTTSPSRSNSGSATLTGESLQTVESRSVSGDFRNFFTGRQQAVQGNAETVGRLTESRQNSPVGGILGNDIDVTFGDTLNSSRNSPVPFSAPGDQGDNDRVRLQIPIGEQ